MVKSWATRIVCGLRDRLRKSQRVSLTQDWLAVLLQHPLRTSRWLDGVGTLRARALIHGATCMPPTSGTPLTIHHLEITS